MSAANEWIDKISNTMIYYVAIKSNEGSIHATKWMNARKPYASERSQSSGAT